VDEWPTAHAGAESSGAVLARRRRPQHALTVPRQEADSTSLSRVTTGHRWRSRIGQEGTVRARPERIGGGAYDFLPPPRSDVPPLCCFFARLAAVTG
jgi:hypothetical protein